MLTRRQLLALAAAALAAPRRSARAAPDEPDKPDKKDTTTTTTMTSLLTRPIPRTGEALPAIGLGTYSTFDVGPGARAPLVGVMRRYLELGGRVIDSSPMYGQAEAAVGETLAALGHPKVFLATKVWTRGEAAGKEQMARSAKLFGAPVDLMQIHNLVDWKTHLATLRDMKAAGTIRYIGVTHYALSALGEIEEIVKSGAVDFIQVPYSVAVREAEKRVLPAAADHKVAVLVMRPFEEGELFGRVKGKPLPPWAAELGIGSWAQLFLKFILGHPAVTAPIPATANLAHLEDNMGAGRGRLPTAAERKKMIDLI